MCEVTGEITTHESPNDQPSILYWFGFTTFVVSVCWFCNWYGGG